VVTKTALATNVHAAIHAQVQIVVVAVLAANRKWGF